MKKNKGYNFIKDIPVFISIAVLFVFAVLFLELPMREFSDNENRMLAICPEPSKKSILDGSFQDSFENFVSDQFPMRDELLGLSVPFLTPELSIGIIPPFFTRTGILSSSRYIFTVFFPL